MQRLGFSSYLCLPQRLPLLNCRTAQRRQRGLRLVCPAGPAVADAPPKGKPGRPKKKQTEEASPAKKVAATEPKKTENKVKKPHSEDEEMPTTKTFTAPWDQLSQQQIAQQNAELEALQKERDSAKKDQADTNKWRARESYYNKFIYRDPEWLEMESKLLIETNSGYALHSLRQT